MGQSCAHPSHVACASAGAELVARGREALAPIPVVVPVLAPTAALPAAVPLPIIPIVPSTPLVSFAGTVIVAALSSKLVPAPSIVLVVTVTHGAVRGGLGAAAAVGRASGQAWSRGEGLRGSGGAQRAGRRQRGLGEGKVGRPRMGGRAPLALRLRQPQNKARSRKLLPARP